MPGPSSGHGGSTSNHDGDPERDRPCDAAGDRQPVCRHGRAASDVDSGLAAWHGSLTDTPHRPRRSPRRRQVPPFANGSTVTVSGTATDSGGGVVAGVEVSTDGGSTWHPVTTMSPAATSVTWSYTWSAAGNGPVTINVARHRRQRQHGDAGPRRQRHRQLPMQPFREQLHAVDHVGQ